MSVDALIALSIVSYIVAIFAALGAWGFFNEYIDKIKTHSPPNETVKVLRRALISLVILIPTFSFSTYNLYRVYTGEAFIDECKQLAKDYYLITSYQKDIGCVMKMNTGDWEKFDEWDARRHRTEYLLKKHKNDFMENEYNAAKDRVQETNLFGE